MTIKKKKGTEASEKVVVLIEGVKAVLKLALMRVTDGRTGVNPPIAEREVDPNVLELRGVGKGKAKVQLGAVVEAELPRSSADVLLRRREARTEEGVVGEEGTEEEEGPKEYWTGTRTGVERPTLASLRKEGDPAVGDPTSGVPNGLGALLGGGGGKQDAVRDYLMTRVLTIEDVKRPEDLIDKAKGLGKVAEVIWILRPLVYGTFPSTSLFISIPPLLTYLTFPLL